MERLLGSVEASHLRSTHSVRKAPCMLPGLILTTAQGDEATSILQEEKLVTERVSDRPRSHSWFAPFLLPRHSAVIC